MAPNKVISKDKEEEMSSALIAKLLAEDAMNNDSYYAEYSNDPRGYDPYSSHRDQDDSYEDNSEDDFNPKKKTNKKDSVKKGKKRKTTAATPKPKKEPKTTPKSTPKPTTDESTTDEPTTDKSTSDETNSTQPTVVTKKPKKQPQEGYNTGVYNELEEKNFLEGLELFGREWTKLQLHVGTRDSNSIRSHAQKHFIKMYRDNIPLPEKVRATGEGYTLSGKPLDPNSAAAKPYLSRNGSSTKKVAEQEKCRVEKPVESKPVVLPPVDDPMEGVEKTVEEPKHQEPKPAEAPVPQDGSDKTTSMELQTENLSLDDKKLPKKKKTKSSTPSPSNSSSTNSSATPYDVQGRTSYSTSRLRKQRDPTSVNYGAMNDDPLTMIKCEPFIGKPGSNVSGCQPFEMTVESNVLLAMDFHAHLMTTEIIGFLAGEWDKENKRIIVREAFPCRSIETGQNDVNVEMDPTSAIETRQLIEERQLKVVGWYHSHPTFIPDPSLIDIENQRNYQTLCREDHPLEGEMSKIEPFVGAIVGPYDPALPASSSVINWFYVNPQDRSIPRRLIYELQENESISQDETQRLFTLLDTYKDSSEKVKFDEFWRQDASETKLQKLIKSLGSRMPWVQKKLKENIEFKDVFLEKIQLDLKDW